MQIPLHQPQRVCAARPRTAVVLAAGNGNRMSGRYAKPKPLLSLLGLRLIERVVLGLADQGVTRFRIVVGAHKEEVSSTIRASRRLRHLAIELVECTDHEAGNGHSLAAGAAGLDEPFFLSMADHVFDPAIVGRLREAAERDPDCVHLATDANIDGVYDLDDATKVATERGHIRRLGKQLPAYDRVDVGVFYCPAWFSQVASETIEAGAHSVSDVMAKAIAANQMRSCPIEPLFWQDVDTPDMLGEARSRLLNSTRKSTDGPVARHFNRHVSIATTRWLAPLGVSPNVITTIAFLMGMAGAAMVALRFADWPWMIAAGLLVQGSSIWDGCDGEVARVTLRRSSFGAWYDTVTDNVRMIALVVASTVGLYVRYDHVAYLAAGGAFLVGGVYLYLTMIGYLRRHRAEGSHLVLLAHIQRNTDAFDKIPGLKQLWALAPMARQDIILAMASAALLLNLPHLIIGGGLLCVAGAITIIKLVLRKTEGQNAPASPVVWPSNLMILIGAGILLSLISQFQLSAIADVWATMGLGIVFTPLIAFTWGAANTCGLSALTEGQVRWWSLFSCRISGDGYNALTSLAEGSGEPVKVQHLRRHLPDSQACSVLVVGRALDVLSGLAFSAICLGVSLVALDWPPIVTGFAVAYLAVALLLAFTMARFAITRSPRWPARWLLAGIDAKLADTPLPSIGIGPVLTALVWHLIGRAALTIEIAWLVHLLGVPYDVLTIIGITGIVSVGAVFSVVIPQSLGVAEAAAVLAFSLCGFPPVMGLAFGLVRRGRMLVVSMLGVAWHALVLAAERREGLVSRSDVSPKPQS